MWDAPVEIIREILSRVPAEPLLRFRCVSKEWRYVIDDPFFAKLHFDRQMGGDMLLIRNSTGKLYSIPLGALNFSETTTRMIEATNIKNVIRRGVPRILDLRVPSCNGWILISDFRKKRVWALCNPFMGEWLHLPPCDDFTKTEREWTISCGLGYDSAASDYKVVRISRRIGSRTNGCYVLKTLIYSLKLGIWHRIQDFPNCIGRGLLDPGVFVNGALHWIMNVKEQGTKVECIVALDLATETYRKLQLPSLDHSETEKHLYALGGCLFLSCCALGMIDYFRLWILRDFEGHKKWTQLVSLKRYDYSGTRWNLRPVAYLKSKEQIVIQYNGDKFMSYDVVEKKCTRKVTVAGIEGDFSSQVLSASLNWLNGSNGSVENITLKRTSQRKRKRANDRLKLKLSSWCDPLESWFSWPGL